MIKLAEIFQNDMMLQRRKPVKIWGHADESIKLNVSINHIGVGVFDVMAGDFEIMLPPQEAMEDATIEFAAEGNKLVILSQVDFGEIWIAGGQSNMEFYMRWDQEGKNYIASHTDPHIRHYEVGRFCFEGHRKEGTKDVSHSYKWMKLNPENTGLFSAVGTYFASELREKLNVPVGIIACNWCGTTASTWLDKSILENDPVLRVYVDDYNRGLETIDLDKYYAKMSQQRMRDFKRGSKDFEKVHSTLATKPASNFTKFIRGLSGHTMGPQDANRPGALYEFMLKEIAGFGCAGVIWYQGESDDNHADIYDRLFGSLINNWREVFEDELPFYYVQLAPFETWMSCLGTNYPKVREAQARVEQQVPEAYMISIMDAGERYDIHPKNKRIPGTRLARKALKYTYGVAIACDEPEVERVNFRDDDIEVVFKNAIGGFDCDFGFTDLFNLKVNGEAVEYDEKLVDNTIIIKSSAYDNNSKVEIAFAYRDYCRMNLYNKAGLAARPCSWICNK